MQTRTLNLSTRVQCHVEIYRLRTLGSRAPKGWIRNCACLAPAKPPLKGCWPNIRLAERLVSFAMSSLQSVSWDLILLTPTIWWQKLEWTLGLGACLRHSQSSRIFTVKLEDFLGFLGRGPWSGLRLKMCKISRRTRSRQDQISGTRSEFQSDRLLYGQVREGGCAAEGYLMVTVKKCLRLVLASSG